MIFTIAFGVAWAATRQWFFVFPFVFAGVLPLVNGLMALPRARRVEAATPRPKPSVASRERQVLQAARDEQGIVTPTVVALKTDLTIREAETILEEMAGKGYALMRVTESGRLEYEFPEFLPRVDAGAD